LPGDSEARAYFEKFFDLPPNGHAQRMVRCPFHEDSRPSFSLNLDTGLPSGFLSALAVAVEADSKGSIELVPNVKRGVQRPLSDEIFGGGAGLFFLGNFVGHALDCSPWSPVEEQISDWLDGHGTNALMFRLLTPHLVPRGLHRRL
jgi:hypothetical protein